MVYLPIYEFVDKYSTFEDFEVYFQRQPSEIIKQNKNCQQLIGFI